MSHVKVHLALSPRPVYKEGTQRQKELDAMMQDQVRTKKAQIGTLSSKVTSLQANNVALQICVIGEGWNDLNGIRT